MKRLALLIAAFCMAVSQKADAISTLSFTGADFEIQIVVSDTSDRVSNIRIYEGNRLVFEAEPEQLNAVRYDPKQQRIGLNVPEKGRGGKIVLTIHGRSGTLTFGTKRVGLRGDWLR